MAATLASCKQSPNGHGHSQGHGHEHGDEGIVALTPEEIAEFDIQLATAEGGTIEITKPLTGEVVMNPDAVAHVVARATGIAGEVFKTIGDQVEAGEILAILDSPALAEAKAAYLSRAREHELALTDLARAETIYTNTRKLLEVMAGDPDLDALREFSDMDLGANRSMVISTYAQLVAAEAEYSRERTLYEKQIGSEADFLDAQRAFQQAQAEFLSVRDDLAFTNERTVEQRRRETKVAEVSLLAAERTLHALGLGEEEIDSIAGQSDAELARYVIAAPISGVITDRHIVRGEQVEQGANVFTVSDLSTVWVALTVYQKDLPVVRPGQRVRIAATDAGVEAEATIDYVNPVIDEATRSTTARVVLNNEEGAWLPGMFIEGMLALDQIDAAVIVPREAIQMIGGKPTVFVETDKGFAPVEVTLGQGDDDRVAIVDGLTAGQRYVAGNSLTLKAELERAELEHAGHTH